MSDIPEIKKIREERFLFMKRLYELVGAYEGGVADWRQIGSELSLRGDDIHRTLIYLREEGLITLWTGGCVLITHDGIRVVEDALSKPDEPTRYFPPVNLISIAHMTNSQIQQGSLGAVQTVTLGDAELSEVRSFVLDLRNSVGQLGLQPDRIRELESDIASLDAQLSSPRPKANVVMTLLGCLKNVLESAAGAVAAALLMRLSGLVP
jgi:hypothetical protein